MAAADLVRFVVLAAPRTGSNWLCTLLDSHPEVLCHHEIFNPGGIHLAISRRCRFDFGSLEERDRDPPAMLRRLWANACGCRAVGFKITRGQPPAVFAAVLADPGLRILLLKRRNRLRTYLSERAAQATGRWESYRNQPAGGPPPPLEVFRHELAEHAASNGRYYQDLETRLRRAGHAWCETVYEELGSAAEQRRLLAFLGVDPERPLEGFTHPPASRDLRERIANFDHLAAELAGSPFAAELGPSAGPENATLARRSP